MMSFVLLVVGAVIGGILRELGGAVLGGVLGYLLGQVLALRGRVKRVEGEVEVLVARQAPVEVQRAVSPVPQPMSAVQPTSSPSAETDGGAPPAVPSGANAVGEADRSAALPRPPAPSHEPAPPRREATPARAGAETSGPDFTFELPPELTRSWDQNPERWDSKIVRAIKAYFTGGNVVVRVGIIVLFFGVAFLLKYAAERVRVPIEARLIGVAIGAIILLVIGWRLRATRLNYGLILQGGGVGVLYLTVFSALRLYHVLPTGGALALLIAIGVFSAILAITQDSRGLAIAGISGGFLAPILTSTGGGNHVLLFSYYALLNAGVLGIAWFKAWRLLNLIGFGFTFVIGVIWGVTSYRSELLSSTEPFLIAFVAFYLGIAVLYALRQAPNLKGYLDGTLVFGTPLIGFGLQSRLMQELEYGLAYSALALSAIYLTLAWILFRKRDTLRLLVEAFLAIGIVFATLAVPLALDGRWTAATWALEGAGILWVGIRQHRRLARAFGLALQLGAGLWFMSTLELAVAGPPVLNSGFIGTFILALAGLFSGWQLHRHRSTLAAYESDLDLLLLAWGALWWLGGGLREIEGYAPDRYEAHGGLVLVTLSAILASELSRRLVWPAARAVALVLPAGMAWFVASELYHASHPFAELGYVVWPLALATYYGLLRRDEDDIPAPLRLGLHALGLWVLTLVATLELAWTLEHAVQGQRVWPLVGWALVPSAVLLGLAAGGDRIAWPLGQHARGYLDLGSMPIAAFLVLWLLYVNLTSNGDPAPLPYLPLLNPLDITQGFGLLAVGYWMANLRKRSSGWIAALPPKHLYAGWGALVFIALNGVLARTLHHWADVPFRLDDMLGSTVVQASFSIFWTVLALATMSLATRARRRALWIVGAALMAVVVVKLFTVDIAGVGGLARVVSFIGVAVLMLIVGYVSPVPPRQEAEGER